MNRLLRRRTSNQPRVKTIPVHTPCIDINSYKTKQNSLEPIFVQASVGYWVIACGGARQNREKKRTRPTTVRALTALHIFLTVVFRAVAKHHGKKW